MEDPQSYYYIAQELVNTSSFTSKHGMDYTNHKSSLMDCRDRHVVV